MMSIALHSAVNLRRCLRAAVGFLTNFISNCGLPDRQQSSAMPRVSTYSTVQFCEATSVRSRLRRGFAGEGSSSLTAERA